MLLYFATIKIIGMDLFLICAFRIVLTVLVVVLAFSTRNKATAHSLKSLEF